jgi:hypothetical protein
MPGASSIPPPAEAVVLSRQRVSDPDAWLEIASWCLVAFSCLQILLFSFGRDQGIYAVVADGILHGRMPYRDLWDFKPPGIYLVYAAAQALLGKSMLAVRVLEVIGLLGVVFAFRRLGESFTGERRVGIVGGAVAAVTHAELEFWHTAQPETFGGYLIVLGLMLTTVEPSRRYRSLPWIATGLLFGAAFVLKPPLAGGVLVCAAYFARRAITVTGRWMAGITPVAAVALSSLVPIGLCALWFRAAGAWPDLWWTLFDFTPGYTRLSAGAWSASEAFYYALQEAFFRFTPLSAFGVVAAISMRPIHSREREGLFVVLGIVSINLAGVAMQAKFFQYHYAATLPLIAFVAGLGYYKLWRRCLAGGVGSVLAFVAFGLVALSMRSLVHDLGASYWERSLKRTLLLLERGPYVLRDFLDRELYAVADYNLGADRDVALEIQTRVSKEGKVLVWGFEPGIYWLADRNPATRFIYNVPQRAHWERAHARELMLADLGRQPPAMIVVQHGDRFRWVTGDDDDSAQALAEFPELRQLIDQQYVLAATVDNFDLYERRTAAP